MKVLAFTGSRAEYYLQRPVLKRLDSLPDVTLMLIVSGSILQEESLITLNDIKSDKLRVVAEVPIPLDLQNKSHALQIAALIEKTDPIIHSCDPDCALVYADRYESFAFAVAAFHANLIVIHLEAGDITQGGTYDDNIRHCISKMSHLHLTSTYQGLEVLACLGEEPWRSKRVGLLSYETLTSISIESANAVADSLGLPQKGPLIIATMHPIPTDPQLTIFESTEFLEGLAAASSKADLSIIITGPNSDKGNCDVLQAIQTYLPCIRNCQFIASLGGFRYHSLLSLAKTRNVIVCGNSSSVIKEAPYYGAHGLNVGNRQLGREKADTQVDVPADRNAICDAILHLSATDCTPLYNPYFGTEPSLDAVEFIYESFQRKALTELLSKKWYHE